MAEEERRVVAISSLAAFQQFIRDNPVVILKAHATWCGPCKRIQPLFEEQYKTLPKGVCIVYVDIDQGPSIARKYAIRSVPCMISLYNGQPYDVVKGARPQEIVNFFSKVKKQIQPR